MLRLSTQPGQKFIEAGIGSRALTLARAVGINGKIYSYDMHTDIKKLAEKNLHLVSMGKHMDLKTRDISEGFDESDIPAIFLDVPNPSEYLK